MQIFAVSSFEKRAHSECLIIPFWKKKGVPQSIPKTELESACSAECDLSHLQSQILLPIRAKDFTGKEGETVVLYGSEPEEARILLLGLGEKECVTAEKLRRAYSAATKAIRARKIASVTLLFPEIDLLSIERTAKAIGEGIFLTNYSFDSLKCDTLKDEPRVLVEKLQCISSETKKVLKTLEEEEKIVKGVYLARDLVNANADDVTPQYLVEVAKDLSKEYPTVTATIHNKEWIEEQGMGLFLAVSRGSVRAPEFIVLKYEGNPTSSDHTVIVGKGITYDTGGLFIKPKGSMEIQRSDMAGAAIALSTIKAIAELSLPVNVTAVIATCENAVGPLSYKPGDVYKGYSGKTVEITDTDAEGRLILADALNYVVKTLNPSRVIDFATLTGAMVVALGTEVAGLMSNSDLLAEALTHSCERTHERVWRFPLYEEYRDYLKSDIADMKNSGGREGGAIIAGVFLQEFVGSTPWAHFDIAGVAYQKEAKRYHPKMATGFGVRLMVDFLQGLVNA